MKLLFEIEFCILYRKMKVTYQKRSKPAWGWVVMTTKESAMLLKWRLVVTGNEMKQYNNLSSQSWQRLVNSLVSKQYKDAPIYVKLLPITTLQNGECIIPCVFYQKFQGGATGEYSKELLQEPLLPKRHEVDRLVCLNKSKTLNFN